MKHVDLRERFKKLDIEVELGFTAEQTAREVSAASTATCRRCSPTQLCIECDACIDVCPVHCLTITPNGEEDELRTRLTAPADNIDAGRCSCPGRCRRPARVMVKDEDVCVHCGLCAERCPTAAWDMQKFELQFPHAGRSRPHRLAKRRMIA